MKKYISWLAFLVSTAIAGEVVEPESAAMSSDHLKRIDPVMQEAIDQGLFTGGVTLVARRGSIIHFEAHGSLTKTGESPMTTDAIFAIASMTKPIAHVAAMVLVEEGKLLLSDPVGKYIPEFHDTRVKLSSGELVAPEQPMRIHHLFRHTSGMSEGPKREEFDSKDDYIRARAQQPLQFHPGERYHYPESTEVLGWVIERVSQKSLRDFLKDRLFEPLSMLDTDFGIPKEKIHREAHLMMKDDSVVPTFISGSHRDGLQRNGYHNARGGLWSTAEDYWKFSQMLLNEGEYRGARILSRTNVRRMLAYNEQSDLPDFKLPGHQMTLGFRVVTDRFESRSPLSEGSFSKGGALRTYSFVDPSEELIGVFMVQTRKWNGGSLDHFLEIIYGAILD